MPPAPLTDAPAERPYRLGDSFVSVLLLVTATFVVGSAVAPDDLGQWLDVTLQGLTLLLTVRVARTKPRVRRLVDVIVVAAIVACTAAIVSTRATWSDDLTRAVTGMLAFGGPVFVVYGLRRRSVRIDRETIAAALTIYLMIGMFFAAIYGAVQSFMDQPFFAGDTMGERADFLYYSFITMATVGFGDFTPAEGIARSLTVFEAILGQLYLVTVVSVVVGNLGRTSRTAATED